MLKKMVGVLAVLFCVVLFFSGCVNATYEFKIHHNGSVDAKYTILFDTKTADAEVANALIAEFRKRFTEDKYEVSDYEENGLNGIKVTKRDVTPEELVAEGQNSIDQMDYASTMLQGLNITQGIFADQFQLDTAIDLSFLTESYLVEKKNELIPNVNKDLSSLEKKEAPASSVYKNDNVTVKQQTDKGGSGGEEIYEKKNITVDDREIKQTPAPTGASQAETKKENVNKIFANANLKVVMRFPDKVVSSNAGKILDGGKTLEWILIPGTVNKINAKGYFTNTLGYATVWTSIALVILIIALIVFLVWKKRKKKQNK